MVENKLYDNGYMPDREMCEYYGQPFQKTPQITQVYKDSYFPVYTYRYDEHTNILTQYKNGVEYMRMFVPEPYELKESI